MVSRQDMKNWSHWLSFVFVEGNVQSRGEYSSKGIRLVFKNNSFLFIYLFPSDVLLLSAKQWSSVAFLLFALGFFFPPLCLRCLVLPFWICDPNISIWAFCHWVSNALKGIVYVFLSRREGELESRSLYINIIVLLMAMWMWLLIKWYFAIFRRELIQVKRLMGKYALGPFYTLCCRAFLAVWCWNLATFINHV